MSMTVTPGTPLRVVTGRHGIPRWAFELLTRLREEDIELHRLQLDSPRHTAADNRWHALVTKLDSKLFPGADTASATVDDGSGLAGLFAVTQAVDSSTPIESTAGGFVLSLDSTADHHVAKRLDVPVLSLQPNADGDWRSTPVGFWECLDSQPMVGLRVIATDATGTAKPVMQATECTDPVSVGRTRNAALWAGAELLHRALTQTTGVERTEPDFTNIPSNSTGPASAWSALVRAPWHFAKGVIRKMARRKSLRQWILIWRAGDEDATNIGFSAWRRLLPPRDIFWADPFVVERDGQRHVFIEEATFTPRRGHLAVMTLDDSGQSSPPVTILKKPYHLSYPNVFEHDGEWYMMPESGEDKSLQIYRSTAWPHEWTWTHNALSGLAVYDGTLVFHNAKWWLFATVQQFEGSSPNVFLHLWHADSPLGPWTPHRANPVCTDVRSARPAGNFFEREGVLYRPSQNCSRHYGYGLQINRVEQLDETAYRETQVASYTPWASDIDAVHTLNRTDTLQLADAVHWRPPG